MKQLSFISKPSMAGGGSLSNTRHSKRVLSARRPIHLVLKAITGRDLFHSREKVKTLTNTYARRFGVRIYGLSVQRGHVHFVLRIPSRQMYVRFIRSLTSMISRYLGHGLWSLRPYTRVGSWGREFKILLSYLFRNDMEVLGIWGYRPRRNIKI